MSRLNEVIDIFHKHRRVIIFYNFDYELEILQSLYLLEVVNPDGPDKFEVAEWNGHLHQEIPRGKKWVYLVQYTAGCEGWNCITTDTIVFFTQNYSYKMVTQAAGRIDRLNSPFIDLYYYHLKSKASIDLAISRALDEKKKFNEGTFVNRKEF
jgi:superfamily II DNA or RNA helicase